MGKRARLLRRVVIAGNTRVQSSLGCKRFSEGHQLQIMLCKKFTLNVYTHAHHDHS